VTITGIQLIMHIKLFPVLLIASLSIPLNAFASEVGNLQPIGTMGKGQRVLGDGKEAVLYEHQGKGCISHFWFGGNFKGISNSSYHYWARVMRNT
jgi:hypothetical protein